MKSGFLHPTLSGNEIRTLAILKQLHRRHEIHYLGLHYDGRPEGPARAHEYSTSSYPVAHHISRQNSLRYRSQAIHSALTSRPIPVIQATSKALRKEIERLLRQQRFDRLICDYLFPSANLPDLSKAVVFQHNVEAEILRRTAGSATGRINRAMLRFQHRQMQRYEAAVCRTAGHVIAVSPQDAQKMREEYQAPRVSHIPTGVDLEYLQPPPHPLNAVADLVFVGTLDWMPNIDGLRAFLTDVLPRIHARRPETTIAIVGRNPGPEVHAWAQADRRVTVAGSVPDIRPYLWGAQVAIVPLRIGGGTRLKIYEAIAAGVPVVSTEIGAEGLPLQNGAHIRIANEAERFADACLELLTDAEMRIRLARSAREFVAARFSNEKVAEAFEKVLEDCPAPY